MSSKKRPDKQVKGMMQLFRDPPLGSTPKHTQSPKGSPRSKVATPAKLSSSKKRKLDGKDPIVNVSRSIEGEGRFNLNKET